MAIFAIVSVAMITSIECERLLIRERNLRSSKSSVKKVKDEE